MSEKLQKHRAAAKAAFPHTIPILFSFLLVGLGYGIFAKSQGLPSYYPTLMSILIFAGSMEFVTVNLLVSGFDPLGALLLSLTVNARYFFYGISMLEKYRDLGKKKAYMIYGMCDETFSINCTAEPPAGVDKGLFQLWVTLLNQIYWVIGATLGGVAGSILAFDTRGIEFILTALYVVIFLDQWRSTSEHVPALTGLLSSVACLVLFGADNFVIPALMLTLCVLLLCKPYLTRKKEDVKS